MRWLTESKALPIAATAALLIIALSAPAVAQGTAAGTEIENSATLNYQNAAGVDQTPVSSSTVTVTVDQIAGVSSSPTSAASSGAAGAAVYYAFTVTNTGNGPDTFALTAVSAHNPAWTVAALKDDGAGGGTANDGVHQSGETNVASDTGEVASEGAFHGFLVVSIPSGTADGTADTETLTARSQLSTDVTAALACTTTAAAAVMSLDKTVDLTSAAPGDSVTYTLAYENSGSVDALQVVITDTLPDEVTYVAGSATLNGGAKTDAADGDEITVSSGTVTVNLGTVAAGAQGTVTFQVAVK